MRRTGGKGREATIGAALVLCSLVLGFIAAEVGARLLGNGGTLTAFPNYVANPGQWEGRWRTMRPDPLLGYIPRDGYSGSDNGYRVHISYGADGFRQQNRDKPPSTMAPPILVVGDSFAMGAEVGDDESWSAYMEEALDRRVLTGGVPGYGIDQAVLRAETLVGKYKPDIVIVGLIADDVERARMRILWGLRKPYFEIETGTLALRNVPLPEPDPHPRVDPLRRVLGYSYLIDVAMRRLGYMAWWRRGQPSHNEPAHDDGDKVACLLMDRLAALRDQHKTRVVLVAQYSIQTWEAERFRRKEVAVIRAVADCARARGIDTIDTYSAIAEAVRAHGIAGLYTGTHLSAVGNRLTAGVILDWLKAHP